MQTHPKCTFDNILFFYYYIQISGQRRISAGYRISSRLFMPVKKSIQPNPNLYIWIPNQLSIYLSSCLSIILTLYIFINTHPRMSFKFISLHKNSLTSRKNTSIFSCVRIMYLLFMLSCQTCLIFHHFYCFQILLGQFFVEFRSLL